MSTAVAEISAEEAEEYVYGGAVATQTVSKHRWYERQLIVYSGGGDLRGFYYLKPATEEQEGQDRFESDPVQVFAIVSKQITSTVFVAEEAAPE